MEGVHHYHRAREEDLGPAAPASRDVLRREAAGHDEAGYGGGEEGGVAAPERPTSFN